MPLAVYALTAGAFGIGTTEFVIMGLLMQVAEDLQVSIAAAGLLISGYALGVFVGAPLLTAATGRLPRKAVLVGLMVVFTLGNLACALAVAYTHLDVYKRQAFLRFIGVDRTGQAVAHRASQTRRIDAIAGQVVIHGLGATLGQALVCLLYTSRCV